MRLQHASLSFNQQGTLQSTSFDDVYFSNENAIAESNYVFIQGNALLKTWENWQEADFYIGETGFGTGLNFLCTLQAFESFLEEHPKAKLKRLHYISFEQFPIEKAKLETIHQQWPELNLYSQSVLNKYPPALEGMHRSFHSFACKTDTQANNFVPSVCLDLMLGEAAQLLAGIHEPSGGFINAWYLDGFAPSKNKSMWQPSVYQEMARLSKQNATLATFTAAGAVKRGLEAVGFTIQKIKGFGRKRDMITACFSDKKQAENILKQPTSFVHQQTKHAPYFSRLAQSPIEQSGKHIAVVGAGIAGALLALRLTQAGQKVTLLCKDKEPAQGASGNPIAGFYPQLNAEAGVNSQFFVHAFLYARHFYDDLLAQGISFEHDFCSVLQLAFNENTQTRLEKMRSKALWPEELACIVDAQRASDIAQLDITCDALHLPKGGWISPVSLVDSALQKAKQTGLLVELYEHELLSYQSNKNGVELMVLNQNQAKQTAHFDTLVIAAGAESMNLAQVPLPARLTRGQVEAFPASKATESLHAVLCHKGYFTPAVAGKHALGSTYVKIEQSDANTEHRNEEVITNLNMHTQALQGSAWVNELETADPKTIAGRAAIRCSTPDHLPMVGAMPDIAAQQKELAQLYKALPLHRYPTPSNIEHVYLLAGLGSRGITSAPILVDTLVAQLLAKPFPLQSALLDAIMPNRFLVRSLIRQQTYVK